VLPRVAFGNKNSAAAIACVTILSSQQNKLIVCTEFDPNNKKMTEINHRHAHKTKKKVIS